jgi:hypothetical protein
MANIHHKCLYESRVNSFNPKSLSQCCLCGCAYRTVDTKGHLTPSDASRELYVSICKYIGYRVGGFSVVVVVMGFVPGLVLGRDYVDYLPSLGTNRVVNHLLQGTVSTLTCAGGWFFATISTFHFWTRLLHNPFARFGGGRFAPRDHKARGGEDMRLFLIVLAVSGLAFLLYHLSVGVWDLVRGANAAAGANVRSANRSIREDIAKRHRVVNLRSNDEKKGMGSNQRAEKQGTDDKGGAESRRHGFAPEID